MAKGGKIRKSDVIDPGVKTEIEAVGIAIKKDIDLIIKFTKEAKKLNTQLSKSKSFRDLSENAKKVTTNVNQLTEAEKKLATQTKRLAFEASKAGKAHAVQSEKIRRARRENREYAKSQLAAVKSTNTWRNAAGSFAAKFNTIGNVLANVAQVITRTLVRAMKEGVKILIEFEQSMADVQAITGATTSQFKDLKDSAIDLGGSTKFTAVQVAQLQKEFAKLGFSTAEILNASEATLNLAAATGTDLARAAEVAGVTLRGFNLDAKETGRVTDVMAKAFTSSALDMEKFAESMKFVAPIAKAAGASIEEASALLAILADSGISGSMAGTSLRKIFGELVGTGGKLSDRLRDLSEQNLTLADAESEVGERARTSLLVLLDQIDKVPELTKAFQDAGGAAEEMARIQLDTLNGQLTILRSSYEGLITKVGESEAGMETAKNTATAFSQILQGIGDRIGEDVSKFTKFNRELRRFAFFGILSPLLKGFGATAKIAAEDTDELSESLSRVVQEGTEFEQIWRDLALSRGQGDSEGISGILENINTQIKTYQNLQVKATTEAEIATYAKEIKILQDRKRLLTEVVDVEEEERKAIEAKLKAFREAQVLRRIGISDMERQLGIARILSDEAIKQAEDEIQAMIKLEEKADQIHLTKDEKAAQDRIDLDKATEEQIRDNKIEIVNQGFEFISALTDSKIEKALAAEREELKALEDSNDKAQALLEDRYSKGLISQEDFNNSRNDLDEKYGNQRSSLEEKFAEESLKLRRRTARLDKAQALFNIGINTAVAVTKITAEAALAAPLLIPLIIASGLAQAATVLATPIPQFAKGVGSSPEGAAWVGEKGPELRIEPDGSTSLTPGKATLTNLKKGTQIIPNDMTESLLGYSAIATAMQSGGNDELMKETNQLLKSIRNKPTASSTITPAGVLTMHYRGNTTQKKLDKFFK